MGRLVTEVDVCNSTDRAAVIVILFVDQSSKSQENILQRAMWHHDNMQGMSLYNYFPSFIRQSQIL